MKSIECQKRNLPKGWVTAILSDLGEIVGGGTPSTKTPEYWGNEISWITPADLSGYKQKSINNGRKSITQLGLADSSARLIPRDSVLFSSRAPIGYVVIAGNDLSTNQGFKSVVPSKEVFNEYIFYYLKSAKRLADDFASGTTFKEISAKNFARLQIPLPPLAEQHRIVAKIEELFSDLDVGIASLKQAQAQLKTYRQAVLKYAFEGKLTAAWREQNKPEPAEKLLAQIKAEREKNVGATRRVAPTRRQGKTKKPKVFPPLTEAELAELPELPEGWRWIKFGEIISIKSGEGLTTTKMDSSGPHPVYGGNGIAGFHTDYIFDDPKLIIGRVGVKCGVVHITKPKCWVTDNALIADFASNFLDIRYLYFLISYHDLNKFSVSTAQPVISGSKINPIPLELPSNSEQIQIVQEIESRLSVCDKLEESLKESLQKAEALRQSILKKAFAGKLVPQDPNDEPAEKLLARIQAEKAKSEKKDRETKQPRR